MEVPELYKEDVLDYLTERWGKNATEAQALRDVFPNLGQHLDGFEGGAGISV